MRVFFLILLALVLPALQPAVSAAATEKGSYDAAYKAFVDRFYPRAEAEFAEFIQRYTNSPLLPDALLFQAKARLEQGNTQGAVQLLTSRVGAAGQREDEYIFWLAEAYLRADQNEKAGEEFANLVKKFPSSTWRLEAAIRETIARSKLREWGRVIELLQDTNGVFQIASRANATNELVLRGHLLLSEAHFAQGNLGGAEAALQPATTAPMVPRLAWQRQFLTCRIQLAQGRVEQALNGVTNLLTLATNSSDRVFMAQSVGFYALLLERRGKLDEAMDAYERNLAPTALAEAQQQAIEKIHHLSISSGNTRAGRGAEVLERFAAQNREAPARDLALLLAGQLRLLLHVAGIPVNVAPAAGTNHALTNQLNIAAAAFQSVIKDHAASALVGKAHLNLGWCFWLKDQVGEAQSAFAQAAQKLPESAELATAFFKLGDSAFRLGNPAAAATNYAQVILRFADHPQVRSNLFEPALYQLVRAAVAVNDLGTATTALEKIFAMSPAGFHTERAVLLAGQAVNQKGSPANARAIYERFAEKAPASPLLPEVRLAIARTYEKENKWDQAISQYDTWLSTYTNAPGTNAPEALTRVIQDAKPRTEYCRAWAHFQAGNETNALRLFTSFISQFPNDRCTPLARWWVADFHYRNGRWSEAEANYQWLYQGTNSGRSDLSYQAQMMAGRAAVARLGWQDAIRYFTNLTSDIKCPPDIWAQASFAYGNALMSRDSTNKTGDYEMAVRVFNNIYERFPTNRLAILALGEKASCLLQWAQTAPQTEGAAAEFQKVIASPLANLTARSIARVGFAVVLEKLAQQKQGPEQSDLLRRALNTYLDVLYYDRDATAADPPDPFWVKKAGLEAGRVAESLQDWPQAVRVYTRLLDLFPQLQPTILKRLGKAQESLLRVRH